MKRAVIAGASGLVGTSCLRLLLENPEWGEILSLVRRPGPVVSPRLREIAVDFSRLSEIPLENQTNPLDAVFVCLGTTLKKAGSLTAQRQVDVDYVVNVARWGLSHGAQHLLVVSSIGADPHSASAYLRMKGEMELQIRDLEYPIVDILQPSVLLGERGESRPVERLSQTLFTWIDPLLNLLLPKYRAIAAEKVAQAMVTLAGLPEPIPGFHVHVSETIPKLGQP